MRGACWRHVSIIPVACALHPPAAGPICDGAWHGWAAGCSSRRLRSFGWSYGVRFGRTASAAVRRRHRRRRSSSTRSCSRSFALHHSVMARTGAKRWLVARSCRRRSSGRCTSGSPASLFILTCALVARDAGSCSMTSRGRGRVRAWQCSGGRVADAAVGGRYRSARARRHPPGPRPACRPPAFMVFGPVSAGAASDLLRLGADDLRQPRDDRARGSVSPSSARRT